MKGEKSWGCMETKKWTIWTSIHLLEWCYFAWESHMWPHLNGFKDEELMRRLFWFYLNFGNKESVENLGE